jgi:hypothetical protein
MALVEVMNRVLGSVFGCHLVCNSGCGTAALQTSARAVQRHAWSRTVPTGEK